MKAINNANIPSNPEIQKLIFKQHLLMPAQLYFKAHPKAMMGSPPNTMKTTKNNDIAVSIVPVVLLTLVKVVSKFSAGVKILFSKVVKEV